MPHSPLGSTHNFCLILMILILLGIQLFSGNKRTINFFIEKSSVVRFFLNKDWHWGVMGWHNENVREEGIWLSKNASNNTPILSDWFWASSIYFFNEEAQPFVKMQYIMHESLPWENSIDKETVAGEKVLFIWQHINSGILMALTEESLLSQIIKYQPQYIVITWRRCFLSIYFDQNPGFQKIAQFGNGKIKIYKIIDLKPLFRI